MTIKELTYNLENLDQDTLNVFYMNTETVLNIIDTVKNIKYAYEFYRKDTDSGEIRYYIRVDNIYGKYFFEQNINNISTVATTLNTNIFNTDIINNVIKYTFDGYLTVNDKITLFSKTWIIDYNGDIIEGERNLSLQENMTQGGSIGDPYIYPMCCNIPVKLPNKRAYYRMFEQDNCFINAYVDKASLDHRDRMIEYARQYTTDLKDVVVDGYFYKKFFISAEGRELVIDMIKHKIFMNKEGQEYFDIERKIGGKDNSEISSSNIVYNISWTKKNNDKITTSIMFYTNPHIENGINVIPKNTRNAIGMLVKNYKPSLMELTSLGVGINKRIHERILKEKEIYEVKNIKTETEKWIY